MEKRLIDANALKNAHIECPDNVLFFGFGEIVERFLQTIDEQPTVDAVPVVRCKDCKYRPYWDEKTSSAVFPIPNCCPCECDDYFYSWVPKDDWFCADGERR